MTRKLGPVLLAGAALLAVVTAPPTAGAQVVDTLRAPLTPAPQPVSSGDTLARPFTPRGAFLRSVLVPGWGHAVVGAPGRGAFYFAVDAATAFMLWKSDTGLARVRNRRVALEEVLTARLVAGGMTDPLEVAAAVAEDPQVEDLVALEGSRSEQRQDWMALGIFFLFLGGADAFVSAHLADFPAAVVVEPGPARGIEIGVTIPVGR